LVAAAVAVIPQRVRQAAPVAFQSLPVLAVRERMAVREWPGRLPAVAVGLARQVAAQALWGELSSR
jgi:hypothetical protein